jgi:GcrA cell cycle regulator
MGIPGADQFSWTDERVALLKSLWADGLSASQIAIKLGCDSRSAIIGKVHRLGLSGRAQFRAAAPRFSGPKPERTAAFKPAKPPKPAKPAPAPRYMPPARAAADDVAGFQSDGITDIPAEDIPAEQRCTLLELTEKRCHWPIGDPCSADFFFCGAGTATRNDDKAMPYCAEHCARAFDTPRRSRDLSEDVRGRLAIAARKRLQTRNRALVTGD